MYCYKCGKEMPNDAIICTGCGCLLKATNEENVLHATTPDARYPEENRYTDNAYAKNKNKTITEIFFIVSLSILCSTFLLCTLPYLSTVSFIFSILSLGCSITGFIFSTGQDSEALKITSITTFAMALTLFVLTLIRLII